MSETNDNKCKYQLYDALIRGDREMVSELLTNAPSMSRTPIDCWSSKKDTVIGHSFKDLSDMIIEHGDKSFEMTLHGITPLHVAVKYNLAEILLKFGANPNVFCQDGWTPLMIAACSSSDTAVVQVKKLVNAGAYLNVNTWSCRMTPIMLAIKKGNFENVKCLVEAGADINIQNIDGLTALDLAKKYEYQSIVNYLMNQDILVNNQKHH